MSRTSTPQRAGHFQKGLKFFIRVEWGYQERELLGLKRVLGIALIIRVIRNHGSQRMKGPMQIYQPQFSKNQRIHSGILTMVLNFFAKNM